MIAVAVVGALTVAGCYALLATRPGAITAAGRATGRLAAGAHGARQPAVGTSPATAATGRTVSITWVGDMTFGTLGSYPAGGATSLLSDVKPDLRSNLTIGNLESALGDLPMSKCGAHKADCYQFEAPDDTAQDLRRDGFAAVNVANNHTLDAGAAGEQSTDSALDAARLKYAGRPGQVTYLQRNGIKIALVGFAPWSYDADALDIPAAEALVRQAREHAQVVIVMEHLGAEGDGAQHVRPGEEYYLGQDRGDPIAFAHGVIDAGADLVVGSGPHVLRGFQWYRGHLIAYSLGNFCGYDTLGLDSITSVSAMLHITLGSDGQFELGSITPLHLAAPGIPEPDPAKAAITMINSLSHADFAGNGAARISAVGKIVKPKAG
jgi:poly-gamma-glutamate capsule biosynthesis protein CapA/YwtB (metallophosphatase superfamily)